MTPDELLQLIFRAKRWNRKHLSLRKNKLTALPSDIGQLTNLQSLDLSGNNLTALPPEIVQLKVANRPSRSCAE